MTGSAFLNQIGLGGFDLGYLLIGMTVTILLLLIFLILLIVQIRKTSKLKKRLDKFLTGKDGTVWNRILQVYMRTINSSRQIQRKIKRIFVLYIRIWNPLIRKWVW